MVSYTTGGQLQLPTMAALPLGPNLVRVIKHSCQQRTVLTGILIYLSLAKLEEPQYPDK